MSPIRRPARAAGPVRQDVGQDHTVVLGQGEAAGQGRGHRLGAGADPAAPHAPGAHELLGDRLRDVARNREPDPFVAARLREDHGVQAHHATLRVHERAPTVPGVDGGIGLDVDHRVFGLQLACHRAHHAEADRVLEAQGAPEGQDELPLPQIFRIGDGQRREGPALHLDDGHVGLAVEAHEPGGQPHASRAQDGPRAPARRGRRTQEHVERRGSLHHVGVGDDVAVGAQGHPGATRPLADDGADLALARGGVAGGHHLHDRGRDAFRDHAQVVVQALERGSDRLRRRLRYHDPREDGPEQGDPSASRPDHPPRNPHGNPPEALILLRSTAPRRIIGK